MGELEWGSIVALYHGLILWPPLEVHVWLFIQIFLNVVVIEHRHFHNWVKYEIIGAYQNTWIVSFLIKEAGIGDVYVQY